MAVLSFVDFDSDARLQARAIMKEEIPQGVVHKMIE
jgi:hypothetical protein